jgi:hypothetical protein
LARVKFIRMAAQRTEHRMGFRFASGTNAHSTMRAPGNDFF